MASQKFYAAFESLLNFRNFGNMKAMAKGKKVNITVT
jgi:hypothetical protein